MNVVELIDENRALRERVATLQAHINGGINCAFFCALPECAKYLSGENYEQDSTHPSRTEALERAPCSEERQPF